MQKLPSAHVNVMLIQMEERRLQVEREFKLLRKWYHDAAAVKIAGLHEASVEPSE